MTGFDYKNYKKYVESLGIVKEDFDIFLKQFLLEMALRIVAEAKETHRAYKQSGMGTIDTGNMVNSWYVGKSLRKEGENTQVTDQELENLTITSVEGEGNTLRIEIGNNAEYSEYVERGHGSYEPRWIMKISVNTIKQQMPKRYQQEFKKFLKQRGVG